LKHSPRLSRTPSNLPDSVHQQLSMYAVAATAAGVGMLAFVQPSEAKIVYTPAHVNIVQNRGVFHFDLNHDGISDFGLLNFFRTNSSGTAGSLLANGEDNGAGSIWSLRCAGNRSYYCAAALPKGTKVGPKGQFSRRQNLIMAGGDAKVGKLGSWRNVDQAYLGIRFVIKGKTHFGWARVKVRVKNNFSITGILTGYAYETIPGKAIIAGATHGPADAPTNDVAPAASLTNPFPDKPQPGSLGALAGCVRTAFEVGH
jgi:hypothetical protein